MRWAGIDLHYNYDYLAWTKTTKNIYNVKYKNSILTKIKQVSEEF